jgi:hypothetical protein
MEEISGAEHEHEGGQKGGSGMGIPAPDPKESEPSAQESMESDAEVQGEWKGANHEKPVGRIKERGLEPPKKGSPTIEVGIPKGQMASFQFLKTELAPPGELARHILPGKRKDLPGEGGKEPVEKDGGGQR